MNMNRIMVWLCLMCVILSAQATISVRDDAGRVVTLPRPAQRVISLGAHATELLFSAGAVDRIVGVVQYSDYPEAAQRIPVIGDSQQIDIERVAALKPDLAVVWWHGNIERQLEQLQRLGIPLFYSEPHRLHDIPESVLRFGQLLGTESVARPVAEKMRQHLTMLVRQYQHRPPVRLFYQIWDKPLYTLNGTHIVNDAIQVCGGVNIFSDLTVLAPNVSIESVLHANPEAMISTDERSQQPTGGIHLWEQYPVLQAVQRKNLFILDGNLLNRSGPRMLDGVTALCQTLERARQNRKSK